MLRVRSCDGSRSCSWVSISTILGWPSLLLYWWQPVDIVSCLSAFQQQPSPNEPLDESSKGRKPVYALLEVSTAALIDNDNRAGSLEDR